MPVPSTPPTILLTLTPSNTPASKSIMEAMESEVASMYPDAASFPWQGGGDWLNGVPEEHNMGEDVEGEGRLWFFMAVDAATATDKGYGERESEDGVVGCVGVRILPWFPLHRAPAGEAMGMGDGIRTAEIKRMFVVPGWRGKRVRVVKKVREEEEEEEGGVETERSVAAHLLRCAEEFAGRELKARRIVLETGMRQVAAMSLYQRAGWVRREDFGDYVGAGESVGGLSRCWEKWLPDS